MTGFTAWAPDHTHQFTTHTYWKRDLDALWSVLVYKDAADKDDWTVDLLVYEQTVARMALRGGATTVPSDKQLEAAMLFVAGYFYQLMIASGQGAEGYNTSGLITAVIGVN